MDTALPCAQERTRDEGSCCYCNGCYGWMDDVRTTCRATCLCTPRRREPQDPWHLSACSSCPLLTSHRQPPFQRLVTDQVTMDGAEILKGISCMVEELLVPGEAIFLWYCYVQRHQRPFKGVVVDGHTVQYFSARMGQSGETRGTSLAGEHWDISLSHHGKSQTHFAYITTAS